MTTKLKYKIIGDDMQAVVITMDRDQVIRAEAGVLMYMDKNIKMDTSVKGGFVGGIKRRITGESFFITSFECIGDNGEVAFSGPYPGKIIKINISQEKGMICQSDTYLCSTDDIDISIAFTKRLGAGFFGGEGFILQKLEGEGIAFLHSGGTIVEKNLHKDEVLRVDTGCLVAFEPTVDYDIKFVGGIKTALFGGEGLFFAKLTGPGKVYLQTLPFSRLADRVISASRSSKGEVRRGSSLGGVIGDIISGD